MTGLACLVLLGLIVFILVQPEVPQPHKVSHDWQRVRCEATTVALERRDEIRTERAIRMARYLARVPEDVRRRPVAVAEPGARTLRPIR